MTEQEFAALEKGDLIHHPGTPEDVWTLVAFQSQYRTWLAVKGIIEINSKSSKFWDCAAIMGEFECMDAVRCMGLKATRIINPGNWDKKALLH